MKINFPHIKLALRLIQWICTFTILWKVFYAIKNNTWNIFLRSFNIHKHAFTYLTICPASVYFHYYWEILRSGSFHSTISGQLRYFVRVIKLFAVTFSIAYQPVIGAVADGFFEPILHFFFFLHWERESMHPWNSVYDFGGFAFYKTC